MKINNVLVVYTKIRSKVEKDTINTVKNTLKKFNIKNKFIERTKLNKNLFKNFDLIIAVGGDGTFLRTSHFIFDKKPLLGVSSDPAKKEGFFMRAIKKDFYEKFKKILDGKNKIEKFQRLEAFIGNKKVQELALNEFYIASERPYHTARYFMVLRGRKESQKSSGVLISTAAGSHAWVKSAGGIALPANSDKFEYLVREPYCGRVSAKCKLINGVLNKNEKIEIFFEVGNGILIVDSLSREYIFKAGQKVVVKVSKNLLYSVSF